MSKFWKYPHCGAVHVKNPRVQLWSEFYNEAEEKGLLCRTFGGS